MEVTAQGVPYEAFKDNEYIESLVKELQENGTNVVVGSLDKLINWGRSNSLWPLTFATDMARFGWEVARSSPRQADFIMVAGTIVHRMAPVLRRLYDQMAEPKYVIATGACAVSGGPFRNSYHVVKGVDQIIPVDVYLPGCPPRPEAMIYAIMQLSRKVKVERFFGGVNRQQKQEEFLREHPVEGVDDAADFNTAGREAPFSDKQ